MVGGLYKRSLKETGEMAKIFRTSTLSTEFDKPGLHLISALSPCLQSPDPESASVLSLIQGSVPLSCTSAQTPVHSALLTEPVKPRAVCCVKDLH